MVCWVLASTLPALACRHWPAGTGLGPSGPPPLLGNLSSVNELQPRTLGQAAEASTVATERLQVVRVSNMQTNLHIVAKRPELKAAVQDEILKFIKEWRSVYGAQEAQGTAALLLNSGAIDHAVLFSLQQVVERALQTVPQAPGQNATPVARAGAMMTHPAVATNATAIQKQAHQQTCLRMDQELLTLLEQYYSRNGGDSLLIAVRKACVFPHDVPSYSNALAAYSDLVVKAIIKGGCPAGGPQTVDAAMASVPDQRPYVKAVIEGMKEKASWMVQFQSGKYPTVMSLLKAIHDDIHFCHSNQERLAEVLRFEFACGQHGGRGNGGKSKRDGSKGRGGKKGDAKPYSYQQDFEKGMFCDGCGAEGHRQRNCPDRRYREAYWRRMEPKGKKGSKGPSGSKSGRYESRGKGKKSAGKADGKSSKKGKSGKGKAASGDATLQQAPVVAAAMQSGALATDGLDYDEVFGDDEDSSGWGDRFPRQSRADERTAYDWGDDYDHRQYGDYGYGAGADWRAQAADGQEAYNDWTYDSWD